MPHIVLASQSPRRQELLGRMGIRDFSIVVPDVDESVDPSLSPEETVCAIARRKGEAERSGHELMSLIGEFGRTRPASADAPEAAAFVRRLQAFITERFYTCTDEVLLGLADAYETPDFRRNIDREGGEGTADFLAAAIRSALQG